MPTLQAIAIAAAQVLVGSTLFVKFPSTTYLLFPGIILAALRLGQRGAAAITFVTAVVAVAATVSGLGPFAAPAGAEGLLSLQAFMGIVATTALTLGAAIEERRQAHRAKDEFLAMLGHELRNPLAPIVTALDLMRLRKPQPKELDVIERQVHHLERLVDDLLDVSRITRGLVRLERRPVTLDDVVHKAVEIASPLYEQRRHHLEVALPKPPLVLDADESRLAQVLANLLTNAGKYTEPGGHITIAARAEAGQVIIEVRDDGVGIAPEMLPRVFELFVRGHERRSNTGGLGLGLTLVQKLVALHGGAVSARSDGPGRGATFEIRLPASASGSAPQRAPVEPSAPAPAQKRILLVDDNEDALELLAEILRSSGYDVKEALDGPSALKLLDGFRPDVAILDIGLPVMDGYELAAKLRAQLGDSVPRLIALTGYGQEHDRARSKAAGFDLHLVKPVDAEALMQKLAGTGSPS
jgi:signal transduction histidine kinase/CheY-like chemotaxis protein